MAAPDSLTALSLGDALVLMAPRGRDSGPFYWATGRPCRLEASTQRCLLGESFPDLAFTSPVEPTGDLIITESLPPGYEHLAHTLGKVNFPPLVLMILDGSEACGRLGVVPHDTESSDLQQAAARGATLMIGSKHFSFPLASALAPETARALKGLCNVNMQMLLQCGHLHDTLCSTVPAIVALIEGGPRTPIFYLKCLYTAWVMSSEPNRSDLVDLYLQGTEASCNHTIKWADEILVCLQSRLFDAPLAALTSEGWAGHVRDLLRCHPEAAHLNTKFLASSDQVKKMKPLGLLRQGASYRPSDPAIVALATEAASIVWQQLSSMGLWRCLDHPGANPWTTSWVPQAYDIQGPLMAAISNDDRLFRPPGPGSFGAPHDRILSLRPAAASATSVEARNNLKVTQILLRAAEAETTSPEDLQHLKALIVNLRLMRDGPASTWSSEEFLLPAGLAASSM